MGGIVKDSRLWKEIVISAGALGLAGWSGWLDCGSGRSPLANGARPVGGTSPERRVKSSGIEVILGRCRYLLGGPASLRIAAGVGGGRLELMGALGAFLGLQL